MAVPSYTTDLQIFNDASDATGWDEFTGMAQGAPPDVDIDLAIYGSQCITSDRANTGLSSNGYAGTAVTLVTDGAFFIWHKFFAPNSLDTIANGGIRVAIGSGLDDYYAWYLGGSDTYPYGGWVNFAVDPRIGSPDMTTGTPDGTFGAVANGWNLLNAPFKGNPFNTDIIRYGRGISEFTGGEALDYATFNGYALVNDNATTGRFGLLQAIAGGYLFKGLMSLGLAATAVDMRDSNVSISIDNTFKVLDSFNRIEVHNAASNIEWTNVSFTALGTVARGQFEMIDNATFIDVGGSFTGMDTFIYQSNADLTGRTFRGCNLVTQGSATMDGCIFDASTDTYALSSDVPNSITNCTLSNNVTALYLPATVTGTITLSGDVFTNNTTDIYWAGTTGTLTVNSPSATTWDSAGTGTAGNGDVVIQNAVVLTISANVSLVGAEVRIYDNNGVTGSFGDELDGIESNTTATFVYGGAGANLIYIQIMIAGYEEYGADFTMPLSDGSTTVKLEVENNV
jgi:hypothetical protein